MEVAIAISSSPTSNCAKKLNRFVFITLERSQLCLSSRHFNIWQGIMDPEPLSSDCRPPNKSASKLVRSWLLKDVQEQDS